MKKSVLCILLVLVMMVSSAALSEAAGVGAKKSVTASDIIVPSGDVVNEGFSVYMPPIQPESVELKVFEEIVSFIEQAPVVEYFPEETVAAIVEKLPETVVVENLTMDEFFPLREIGYEEHYGEVEAVFEFTAQYKETDVVIALVGIPSAELAEILETGIAGSFRDENGIIWIPMDTRIEDGKVRVIFTQEALIGVKGGNAMFALLREGEELAV